MKIAIAPKFTGTPERGKQFAVATARHAERLGFSTLWHPKYVVHAKRYTSVSPYGHGHYRAPDAMRGFLDPVVVLAVLAQVTSTLRLGTYPLLIAQHSPVQLARTLATLDQMSDGRAEIGVGVGWSTEDYAAIGSSFPDRGARTDEYLDVMKRLWTDDGWSEFHGKYVDFDPIHGDPKPVQQPHPPITIVGNSPAALRRAARYGDGWAGYNLPLPELAATLGRLDAALLEAGRTPDALVRRHGRVLTPTSDMAAERAFADRCAELGVDEMIYSLPLIPPDQHLEIMEALASQIAMAHERPDLPSRKG